MIWLVLRFIPIGAIIRIILAIGLVGAVAIGLGVADVSAQTEANNTTSAGSQATTGDSILFSHSPTVDLHSVEVEDGEAVIKMSSVTGGERVIITDSSRQTTGEMERYRYTLEQGENTFHVPLKNPDNAAITVDADGSIYLWVAESFLNWMPDAGHPIPIAIGGGILALVIPTALHLVQTKGQTTAENPIK